MPSHSFHRYISKLAFGDAGSAIHKALDSGYLIYGKEHRKYPPHDPLSALIIGALYDEDRIRGICIAYTHLFLDEVEKWKRKRRLMNY